MSAPDPTRTAPPVPAPTPPADGDTPPAPEGTPAPRALPDGTQVATPEAARRSAELSTASGKVIAGYEILGELGHGGMGVVCKARDMKLNRVVALKMVLGVEAVEQKDLIRFMAEAEAVASVRHPNVVQVFEYGEHVGRPYMALEYCPGGTLAGRLRTGPGGHAKLDPRAAAELVGGIAAGVAAAHDAGIVHRDLKPANVLFDAAGQPKVADFGVAKRAVSDLTATQAALGTPRYMSPEQAGGKAKFVGPPADVWALGVILYECLTGTRPFDGETTDEIVAKVIQAEFDPPRKVRPELPRDLDLICRKCLEKAPTDRYPTARELAEDLRRFAAGESISVRPAGPIERVVRWSRRNRTLAASMAAVFLALTAGTAVSLWQMFEAKGQKRQAEQNAVEREEQRKIAEQRARDLDAALKVSEAEKTQATLATAFLTDMFRSSDPLDFFTDFVPPAWEKQRKKTGEDFLKDAQERLKAETGFPPLVRAKLLSTIGNSFKSLGLFEKAEAALRTSLDLRRANLPAGHADVLVAEMDLARLQVDLGDFLTALATFQRVYEVQKLLNADELALATNRLYQAACLGLLNHPDAVSAFDEVVAVRSRLLKPNHRDTVLAKIGRAGALFEARRYLDVLKQIPEIAEGLKAQPNTQLNAFGETMMTFQGGLLLVYTLADNQTIQAFSLRTAEQQIRKSIELGVVSMPENHIILSVIRFELAKVLEKLGGEKDAEAEALFTRVIKDVRNTCGFAHPKVLVLLDHYCDRLAKAGRAADARKLFDEADAANLERLGTENVWRVPLIMVRARFEALHGDYATATKIATEGVVLIDKKRFPMNYFIAVHLFDAANAIVENKNIDNPGRRVALSLYSTAREYIEASRGKTHVESIIIARLEGITRYRAGERSAGARLIREAEKYYRQMPQSLNPHDRNWLLYWTGLSYYETGDPVGAERFFEDALALSRNASGTLRDERVNDAVNVAKAICGQGRYADALRHLDEARGWLVAQKPKPTDIDLANADRRIGTVLLAAGDTKRWDAHAAEMVKQFGSSTDPYTQSRLAWTVGLRATAPGWDPKASAWLIAAKVGPPLGYGWDHQAFGLCLFRAGDYDGAAASVVKAARGDAAEAVLLGLVACAKGDVAAARKHAATAESRIAAGKPSEKNPYAYADGYFVDRMAVDLLLAELHAAIAARTAPEPRPAGR